VTYGVKKLYADDTTINDCEFQSFIFSYIQVPSPRPVTRRDGHRPSWLFLLSELNAAGEVFVLTKQVGLCFEEQKSVTLFCMLHIAKVPYD